MLVTTPVMYSILHPNNKASRRFRLHCFRKQLAMNVDGVLTILLREAMMDKESLLWRLTRTSGSRDNGHTRLWMIRHGTATPDKDVVLTFLGRTRACAKTRMSLAI